MGAYRLINRNAKLPTLYPRVKRKLSTAKEKGWDIVGGYKLRKGAVKDYIPYPGMQENVCASECNLIFMCGQGTAGKTFSMYFKALGGVDKYNFTARLISVRALDSKKGSSIFRDGVAVCGNFANCEYSSSDIPTFSWPIWNSNLQLIHSNFNYANPSEKEQFEDYAKKQQASLIMIDEATEMKHFGMFSFWFMRNRDDSGMPPQMILSFNPLHEHWTTQMLLDAGYLDEHWYLRKDMIGKVRYFYNKGDKPTDIIWGDTKAEVVKRANLKLKPEDEGAGLTVYDYVKSFTVFTGTAADNRELVHATGGQSVANLHAVGATQRAIVGEAYFGPIEKEEVNVDRQMIQQLWENPISSDENMYATMDIASGKADSAPMLIWKGTQMIDIEYFKGEPNEISDWIKKRLNKYKVPVTNFAYDATGHGYWMQGLTNGVAITNNRKAVQEYDEYGNPVYGDSYYNIRSQLLGKLEVMLKRGDISCAIPKDKLVEFGKGKERRRFIDVLYDGLALFAVKEKNKKIYYMTKEEFKDRYHYSPGEIDSMLLRMIFELDARPKKQPAPEVPSNVYHKLYKRPPKFNMWKYYKH